METQSLADETDRVNKVGEEYWTVEIITEIQEVENILVKEERGRHIES